MRRLVLPLAVLFSIAVVAPSSPARTPSAAKTCTKKVTKGCKKKASGKLADGKYTFKDTLGRTNTLTVSGGGKKISARIWHFNGTDPSRFPNCVATLVDHGSWSLAPDYVEKKKLGFKSDGDFKHKLVPAIETDGSAGGGSDGYGTIDPKTLVFSGQFPIKMWEAPEYKFQPNGPSTCYEGTTFSDVKLKKAK